MTLSDADLERWSKLADEATPGPWRRSVMSVRAGSELVADVFGDSDASAECDAAFIAEARTALPALIDEVRRLRAKLNLSPIPDGEVREMLRWASEQHRLQYEREERLKRENTGGN